MILSPRQLAQTLMEMTSEGVSAQDVVSFTVSFLQRKKKIHLLPLVLAQLEQLHNEQHAICDVSISSAFPLSADLKNEVLQKAQDLFPGMHLNATYQENTSLLGGVVIASKERVWDASVKKTLQELKNSL